MIEAKQLSKSYGDHLALKSLDMKIQSGEIFALLGQNGAGKTTTINCFLGFVAPSSGDALIDGISVKNKPQETKKALAYIPETVMLYPNLTGIENLAFFSSLAGLSYEEDQMKAFLSKAGLQLTAHQQRVGGYSKGMRQKVGIAIALAKKAKALFLDEPTSGLDPKASNEFSEILKELSTEGTAILMATHDIFRAKEVAHRVGIMKEGQLVSQLSASDLSASELEKLYLKTI
jgi:ABC-2 type transport system ATP-binding protein